MMATKTLSCWRVPATDTVGSSTEDGAETDTVVEAEVDVVEQDEALKAWSEAAESVLVEVAGSYQGLIAHTDIAERLQADTGIRTRSNPRSWLDQVLVMVAEADVEAGRPPLSSLVVHKVQGTVGDPYDAVLRLTGQDPISDPVAREKHAAESRMECYRWAGATLPADGGHAALSAESTR